MEVLQDPITFECLQTPLRMLTCCGQTVNQCTLMRLIASAPKKNIFVCPLCRAKQSLVHIDPEVHFPRNRTLESILSCCEKEKNRNIEHKVKRRRTEKTVYTQPGKRCEETRLEISSKKSLYEGVYPSYYTPIVDELTSNQKYSLSFVLVALRSLAKGNTTDARSTKNI